MERLQFRSRLPARVLHADVSQTTRLDQHYTRRDVAKLLYGYLLEHLDPSSHLMVEPSAGEGAFSRLMPFGSIAIDIAPKDHGIIEADFLQLNFAADRPVAVVGNPPFGKNSSMAVRFFNHAAAFASSISFIVPRTFRKASTQNRLDRAFHLLREEPVPRNAFLHEGRPFHVPAVFQIWQRGGTPRDLHCMETEHPDFAFTGPACAHFAIQRVGARAGRVHDDLNLSPSSHLFVRARRAGVREVMERLDFASVSRDVAGNPSLSKSEIVRIYAESTGHGHLNALASMSGSPRETGAVQPLIREPDVHRRARLAAWRADEQLAY